MQGGSVSVTDEKSTASDGAIELYLIVFQLCFYDVNSE